MNTAILYDYLCSNIIDLTEVEVKSKILYKNLLDLKSIIQGGFDLNPDNLELQTLTQYYTSFLEFENTQISSFKKKSKNISKAMLLPQDRNI